MGLLVLHGIFFYLSHIKYKYGKYHEIFRGVMLIPHNNVMDMNNVMWPFTVSPFFYLKNYDTLRLQLGMGHPLMGKSLQMETSRHYTHISLDIKHKMKVNYWAYDGHYQQIEIKG